MYEIFCVLPGETTTEDAERKIEEVKQRFITAGAMLDEVVTLGKQRLAYPIRHQQFGYMYALYVTLESVKLPELRKELERRLGLLRVFVRTFDPAKDKKARAEDLVFTRTPAPEPVRAIATARSERPVPERAPFVFEEIAAASVKPLVQKEPAIAGAVSIEEIDRKLDELLESDLLPNEGV